MSTSTAPSRLSTIADHPALIPAFHMIILIGPATLIGSLSRGTPLTVVPLVSGSFASEPGFDVRVDAQLKGQGVDYVHNDPDGGRMRLRSDLIVGDQYGEVTFETGSMRYKSLEQALFVGSGRFVIDERGLTVEYRISKVCKGPGVPDEDTAGAGSDGGGGSAGSLGE
ncbi:hypothetical protein H2200_007555 [Cladophialophora chaetospira]|uniref:Uncharacterized protein n=1 Tax=Cladophialophora chaetospira TaxID=386627 RepID=A0AA38X5Z6_9EURO|nr:hypothetical protein H2200_007555 [Cladophialophora chaetospira]